MTLLQLQQKAAKAIQKLDKLMNPNTTKQRVVITLEIDAYYYREDDDPETGYVGGLKFDYDDTAISRQIESKIEEQLTEILR